MNVLCKEIYDYVNEESDTYIRKHARSVLIAIEEEQDKDNSINIMTIKPIKADGNQRIGKTFPDEVLVNFN